MARKAKTSKKKSTVTVDFTGVESRQTLKGKFHAVIDGVTQETGDSSGEDYLKIMFAIDQGKYKGQHVHHNCSLQPKALWNLRRVLDTAGYEVADGSTDIDLEELAGGDYGCYIQVEPNDRGYNEITAFYAGDDDEDDEAEDDDDDGEAEAGVEEDEVMAMSADELEELIEDEDLDVDLDEFKTIKKKRAAVWQAYENKDDDDSDDEDKPTAEEINEMNAKELEELVEEHDLDVKLDGTLRKKRRAVIKALGAE